ncbi:hypothetical protein [Streptomyces cyanogenus]|uniref:Hint domain-containing protein n=1 Tax=Streptomyces cyanogenus TaxID=80860 RepID=A0ABX7TI26_STRCY|nr:hypothetical protein [Streptomyces cyanogenus]QTD96116.1 hypothetical protein S1361_02095 [Streptomyces cyanogenus]
MFIAVSPPPVTLSGAVDPVIESIVNLMPDYSAGRRLHTLYVNKTQSALPGNYSQMFGTGPAFRSVFFPNWQPDSLLSLVADTGLSPSWWSDFSVAVLCQAIAELGSDIRGQMLTDKINGDVSSFNADLRARSSRAYAKVLAAAYNPLTTLLQQVNPDTAKQQFHDSLLSNVLNRQLWYQAGMWTSPDWEMFNQYAKYIALGASDAEVDTLIDELAAAGLPIPATVNRQGWRTYAEELRDKPNIDLSDIRNECAGPIAQTTYIPTGNGMSASMPNGNCYEFTANSQPGTRYRRPPGGSCFTGDTQVLNEAGRAVPLREVKRGDTVLTRDGVSTVAYVARPLRSGRPLYRLTGGGSPVFTTTHPFLNAAPVKPLGFLPKVLAVEPEALAWQVPTLSEDGIGILETGSLVLCRGPGPRQDPVTVTVSGVEPVPEPGEDSHLYDLRLATRSGARQEFWAGDGERFFLVSPEYPILDEAGAAATTVVALMEGLVSSGGPDKSGWPSWINDGVSRFGPGIFHGALMQALATTSSFGAPEPPDSLDERIDRLYRGLADTTPETAAVMASLFDGLLASAGQWLASVVALGWRTCMLLGGETLALTVFDIALTPGNPVRADATIELAITARGRNSAQSIRMWDRRGRGNTRFHHYFDQLVHLDVTGTDRPEDLSFAVSMDGATVPTLFAHVPDSLGDAAHTFRSAQLRDSSGTVVGAIRFDTRRLGQDAASQELGNSGLWTEDAIEAYANALGVAMVEPTLSGLREIHRNRERSPQY